MGHFSDPIFAAGIPAIGFCEEKARLMDEFLNVIHELGQLQAERSRAVIDGESDVSRFDGLIRDADERKDSVKNACLAHVARHRC